MKNILISLVLVMSVNAMSSGELKNQLVCINDRNLGISVSRLTPTVKHLVEHLYRAYKGKHHKFELTQSGSFEHYFKQYGKEEIRAYYIKTKAYDGRTCHRLNKLKIDGKIYTDKTEIMFIAIDWAIPVNQ